MRYLITVMLASIIQLNTFAKPCLLLRIYWPCMSTYQLLLDVLESQGISLQGEVKARVAAWDDEVVDVLLAECRQTRGVSSYQKKEILGGRGESLVYGDYVIREPLGAGGQAEVFKANHVGLRRIDAIKVIRRDLLASMEPEEKLRTIGRFEQGVRAAAMLAHENIVRTHGFDRRRCFVAMEFVDGPDLHTLADQAPISERDARNYVLQVARSLDYAHTRANPVIHRDIKPQNLLLDESSGTVKVSDWGMARIDSDDSQRSNIPSTRLTRPGEVFGSVCFMSPEQAEEAATVDPRSDIYSLGCTLYTLLNRRPIYERSTPTLTMLAHCDPTIPVPSLFSDHHETSETTTGPLLTRQRARDLDAIFQKMVAKELDDRYQSMEEVVAALDDFED